MKISVKYFNLLATGLSIIIVSACNNQTKPTTDKLEKASVIDTSNHGYNKLANKNNKKAFTISDFNTDNKEIKDIDRPSASIISTRFDTSLLFNVWTSDPNGPHADFQLTSNFFYVVDYHGDGNMPYELTNRKLKIYYKDFIQEGEIISVDKDTLKIMWKDFDKINIYEKWIQ